MGLNVTHTILPSGHLNNYLNYENFIIKATINCF